MVAEVRANEHEIAAMTGRIDRADAYGVGAQVRQLLAVGRIGLALGHDPASGGYAQTVRRDNRSGETVRREGSSVRYAAIAALGLARLDDPSQRAVLHGATARDLARAAGLQSLAQADPGAVALAAWAVVETTGTVDPALFARLDQVLSTNRPIATVDLSWIVTAAVAGGQPTAGLASAASARLLAGQGPAGLFPHVLPGGAQNRWRRHVGSFADQVYPIQALARLFGRTADSTLLEAAERTASRICDLQGKDGQWWWHYDVRTGAVVERFPVYSVHQHAMAPMTLFDLAEVGGTDHTPQIVRGLGWLNSHPEVNEDLVCEPLGMIWRKAGRHEPPKATRRLAAVTTALRPGWHLRGLDRLMPPDRVDHECRPYELGWLLHAWLPGRQVSDHV